MKYRMNEEKSYAHSLADVTTAMNGAVEGLGGKVLSSDPDQNQYTLWLDKKILGRVLGDRSQLEVTLSEADGNCQVQLMAFPVDPIGREMGFGVRKGALKTAVTWFWAHLEHRLPKAE